jgi:uncharacterized protein YdcH (DUF465 family)
MVVRLYVAVLPCVAIAVACLVGCQSVVYKDAASSYVTSGRVLTKQIGDTTSSLAAAQDRLKLAKIATDAQCPISENRLFVRDAPGNPVFGNAINASPKLRAMDECRQLVTCEKSHTTSTCARACYSREEGKCVMQIELDLANASQAPDPAPSTVESANAVAKRIQEVEYGRTATTQSKIVIQTLGILTGYLDILDKLAEARTSDIQANTKDFSDKATDAYNGLSQLTGRELSSSDKKTRDNVASAVTAFGKLAGDISKMVQEGRDADGIKAYVAQHADDVPNLISAIRPLVKSDALLADLYTNLGALDIRQALEKQYAGTKDAYTRMLIFSDRDKYQFADTKKLQANLDAAFDALLQSHNSLVALIRNPSDEQQQKLRSASWESFKLLASDFNGAFQAFRAF